MGSTNGNDTILDFCKGLIMNMVLLKRLLLLLFISNCIGCNSNTDPKNSIPLHRTSITFMHYFTDSLQGGINEMAKTFNSKNSQYDLNPISVDHESFESSIRPNLEAGNPPDLYSYWSGARTNSILEYLEPIDDIWQQNNLNSRFSPVVVKAACVYNGKKYFIPLTQHYVGFFYNRKIFEASGLKPPKTWREFLYVCETLKSKGIIPIALGSKEKWTSQFWFDLLLMRTASNEFRQKLMTGEIGYKDPKVGYVFKIWSELLQKGYFNPRPNDLSWDTGANELVYNGKAAMTLMGTWIIGYFSDEKHHWVAGKDYDFFPFPIIDPAIPKVSTGPIDGLVLPKKAINKQGAKEVMVFLTEAEPQKAMSKGSGAIAPSTAVPVAYYSDIQQRVLRDITNSSYFAFPYDLSTPPAIADMGVNAFTELIEFPKEYLKIQSRFAIDAELQFRTEKQGSRQ